MSGTPFGRYELLRKIAAGGMAEIFLARLWGEGGFFRDVVIKRLFRHLSEHQQTLRMFQYEARLLAELCHPNIPQVIDLGCADQSWYMALEYVEGSNIADAWRAGIRRRQVMPMNTAIGIVMQTCEALHHAHERRDRGGHSLHIVHRDVTPQNVMLTRDGVVKLMDFGVASTAARRDTEAGVVKGTFSYMAPEQVRGRRVDRRADVFSLGVILYELTTGSRLFRGNDIQVMTSVVETDAPPPSGRVPNYPPDLEAIVLWALRREADERLPTAAEFAFRLEDFARRSGWPVGPRTLAEYFNTVFPAERLRDASLALVQEPTSDVPAGAGGAQGTGPTPIGTDELSVFELDEEELQPALETPPPSARDELSELGEPAIGHAEGALRSELPMEVSDFEVEDLPPPGAEEHIFASFVDPVEGAGGERLARDTDRPPSLEGLEEMRDVLPDRDPSLGLDEEPEGEDERPSLPPLDAGLLAEEVPSLPPLAGFDDDLLSDVTQEPPRSEPHRSPPAGDSSEDSDYMRDLERRLEDDD